MNYPKARVLVVDDSAVIRRLLVPLLEKLEITEITEAENGQIALDLIKQQHFDLVLLDWEMPVLSGIDLLEILKADEKLKTLPVIMITSKGDEPMRAIQLGIDRYIMKPFTEELTLAKVGEILSKTVF